MESHELSNSSSPELNDESDTFLTDKERHESNGINQSVVASSSTDPFTDFYQAWRWGKRVIIMATVVGLAFIGLCGTYYSMLDKDWQISEMGRGEERTQIDEWGGTPQTVKEWSEAEDHWRAYNWTAPEIDESLKRMLTNLTSV